MHSYYPPRISLSHYWRRGLHSTALLLTTFVICLLAGCVHVPREQPEPQTAPDYQSADTSQSAAATQPSASLSNLRLEPAQDDLAASDENEQGQASYYGRRFAGQLTASGQRFNPNKLTAAHRNLPFGTRVRVTNLNNGKHTVVRINDRGPFAASRVIDLSRRAAQLLGMLKSGVAPVRLTVLN